MKKTLFIAISILVLVSCKSKINPSTLKNQAVVQDYANLFHKTQKDSLSQKIIKYESTSSNEICVYTIDSLPKDVTVHRYATKLANTLGVGKKEKDNGLFILVSKYDREISIATGFGTEKIISDYQCKTIIDSTIVPQFKNGDFYKGINNAIDSLIVIWH